MGSGSRFGHPYDLCPGHNRSWFPKLKLDKAPAAVHPTCEGRQSASSRSPPNLPRPSRRNRRCARTERHGSSAHRIRTVPPGHGARMDRPFRDAVIRAGLDPAPVTPHVMWHTAITKLVQAGIDLPTIQRISGRKTVAMVLRYTHVHGQHIDQAIRAIGRTRPEPPANETSRTITHELHTGSGEVSAARRANGPKER
jgi:hypothetical protein